MKIISQLTTDITRADYALAHQEQFSALLTQYFSDDYQSLFAVPNKKSDDLVEWYSPVSGEPIALNALHGQEKDEAREALDKALSDMKKQTALLASQHFITDEERHILDTASTLPDSDSVYMVDGQPVITWWPRTTPLPPPVAQITAGASAAAAGATLTNIPLRTRKRWQRRIVLIFIVLFFLLFILWMKGYFAPTTQEKVEETASTFIEQSTSDTVNSFQSI